MKTLSAPSCITSRLFLGVRVTEELLSQLKIAGITITTREGKTFCGKIIDNGLTLKQIRAETEMLLKRLHEISPEQRWALPLLFSEDLFG